MPTPQNRQTHSNNSSTNCRQVVNKLKSAAENETWVTLRLSSYMIGYSYDEMANFPHKLSSCKSL